MSKKSYPIITIDPISGKRLQVTRLENFETGIVIEGVFDLSKFNYLTTEQLYFIEVFVKNRGSIKQIEKELDISYPTVKKMLDEVIIGLGYTPDNVIEEVKEEVELETRTTILKQLEQGLLTPEVAFKKLKERKNIKMSEKEKMKVLELLSKGLIDSETAESLLKALDMKESNEMVLEEKKNKKSFKSLKIDITSVDGDDVKINIPLEFAKVLKSKSFNSQINGHNIDIDEILELANSGMVGELINIDSADGDSVKIIIE